MPYAITSANDGWRIIDTEADLLDGETFSINEPILPTSNDQVASDARAQRNAALQQTDWRIIAAMESGNALSDDWKAYRQALRDVPAQKGFPVKIKWPVAPAN